MPQVTSDQAAFLLHDVWLPAYASEHPITKGVIAAIPVDNANYRPDSVAKSGFDLAWHIVGAELMFLGGVAAGTFTFGAAKPEEIRTPADTSCSPA